MTLSNLQLSKLALQVATEAAQLVMKGFRTTHDVQLKPGNEPVTSYDLRSERLLRERLAQLTPDIPVVGEEQGGQPGDTELVWYCDPIDGTINYLRGQPFFGVSVGLARAGVPQAGAVVAPALRQWWRGSIGEQAFRNEQRCRTSDTKELADAVVSAGLPTRGSRSAEQAEALRCLMGRVRDVRRCGSAAIELCMVADGTYDAYLSPRLELWDTCAGMAIARAAGADTVRLGLGSTELDYAGAPALSSAIAQSIGASRS